MSYENIFGTIGTAYNANQATKASIAQQKAAEAASKAAQAKAAGESAWTKYIPLGIGAAILLAIIGFFVTRK